MVVAVVSDMIAVVPGKQAAGDADRFERRKRYAIDLLEQSGAKVIESRPTHMLGLDAVEVTGVLEDLRFSVRLLERDRRRFEFRCYDALEQREWRCESALRSFRIQEMPGELGASEVPQVFHLREPRLGVAFDAPDDTWLSQGPRTGGGGAQTVWSWIKDDRQIDVQTLDATSLPVEIDVHSFVKRTVDRERASGALDAVTDEVVFSGQTWQHAHMTTKAKREWDFFVFIHDDIMYAILVSQPTRDPALVEAAKKGFRLIPR